MRYSVVVLASAMLATVLVLSVSAVDPEEAEAASSVKPAVAAL